ncbi:hypothetical protein ACIBEJ_00800 [Nonomuraea sp. NPDC050790]|uniref:hypothetical protein n=1 Tax=Nonomuraea sp. NPDC050790 TaxID=3364371 RepID=UPI0037B42310
MPATVQARRFYCVTYAGSRWTILADRLGNARVASLVRNARTWRLPIHVTTLVELAPAPICTWCRARQRAWEWTGRERRQLDTCDAAQCLAARREAEEGHGRRPSYLTSTALAPPERSQMRVTVLLNLDGHPERRHRPGDRLAAVYTCTLPGGLTPYLAAATAADLFWAFSAMGPAPAERAIALPHHAAYTAGGHRPFARGDVLVLDGQAFVWGTYGHALQVEPSQLRVVQPLPAALSPVSVPEAQPRARRRNARHSSPRQPLLLRTLAAGLSRATGALRAVRRLLAGTAERLHP